MDAVQKSGVIGNRMPIFSDEFVLPSVPASPEPIPSAESAGSTSSVEWLHEVAEVCIKPDWRDWHGHSQGAYTPDLNLT